LDCWITDRNIYFIAVHARLPKGHKTRKKAQLGEAEPFSNLLLSLLFFMVRQAGEDKWGQVFFS